MAKKTKKPKVIKKPIVKTEDVPQCSEGYVWDDILQKCVLDLG